MSHPTKPTAIAHQLTVEYGHAPTSCITLCWTLCLWPTSRSTIAFRCLHGLICARRLRSPGILLCSRIKPSCTIPVFGRASVRARGELRAPQKATGFGPIELTRSTVQRFRELPGRYPPRSSPQRERGHASVGDGSGKGQGPHAMGAPEFFNGLLVLTCRTWSNHRSSKSRSSACRSPEG